MAAYDLIFDVIDNYFVSLGYEEAYVRNFFSTQRFKELLVIQLADSNVVEKNRTSSRSHQSHVAILSEAREYFFDENEMNKLDSRSIMMQDVVLSSVNLCDLNEEKFNVIDPYALDLVGGQYSIGKRTQKQLQLSKRIKDNSECFNKLRNGLYENDLLIMLKYRRSERMSFALGIKKEFYLQYIEDYEKIYSTNTYLRLIAR